MDIDSLFIKTLEDIEKKMESGDSYEIFMIAPLLRKLLIDGYSLVDQINETRKLKITFIVNNRKLPIHDPSLLFYSMEDGFDPDTSVPHLSHPLEVNKTRLLKTEIMIVKGQTITVIDLIKFLSNVQGAVHAGKPKNTKEHALKEIQTFLGIGGLPAGMRMILSISRIVLKGLRPLKFAVLPEVIKN